MSNSRQLKGGSFLSYIQLALNVCISLIYTPLMIRVLGKSEYGLYNTVASTISMLSVLNLGFSSGYIKYYSQYKEKDDYNSIYKLNGLFLIIFCIIAAIAALCGLYLTLNLDLVFKDGLTEKEFGIAKTLMLLLTFNLCIGFPMSVFSSIIHAHERFIFLKIVGMGKSVLSPLVTIPMLFLGYGSIGIVLVTVTVSLIVDFIYVYYTFTKLRQKFYFHDFEKGIFRSLFFYTSFIAINMIIDQINWNIDKVLLGRFKGTASVAVYSVGAVLQTYYNMFSNAISGVFTPRIHAISNNTTLSAKEKSNMFSNLFLRVGRIQFMVLALVCSGFILFGKPFIQLWAGEGYETSYYVAILLIVPVTIPLIQHLGIEIQRSLNLHQFRSIAYAIMAIANLVMTVYLCQLYGPVGAAFGTALSLILANGIVMNIYYHRKCGINVISFWKSIISELPGLIFPILVGMIITHYFNLNSWIRLLFAIVCYSVCYFISFWFISMNQSERDLLLKPLYSILRKVRKI